MPNKFIKSALKCRSKKRRKEMVKPKKTFRVAVYGTLRQGHHNHRYLNNATYLGTFQTEPQAQFFSNDGETFPYVMRGGHTSVTMEVYEFDDNETLGLLDSLEGYNEENRKTGLYDKDVIKTPYGQAFVYFRHKKIKSTDKAILSGDWEQFKKIGI